MNRQLVTRFLRLDDIPALLRLESRQWDTTQAADAETLRRRLLAHPDLCVGSFCKSTGEALASLFMRPVARADMANARTWSAYSEEASATASTHPPDGLFGISLTSIEPQAASAVFNFYWPHALKNGWNEIYLGSPIPGLRHAMEENPQLDVEQYVHSRRGGLPRDAQLRYYHRKGFNEIVSVVKNYFPHSASLDYGVLLRGRVPLSKLSPLWKVLPISLLQSVLGWLISIPGSPMPANEPHFSSRSSS